MSNQTIEIEIQAKLKGLVKKEGIEASIILEVPRDKGHGELSCNVALIAAKQVKRSPREIADKLAAAFPTLPGGVSKVEVAGPGFINFHLEPLYFHRLLADIVKDPARFGDSDEGNSEKWHFEYVSANPTGPLNVVSARAASIGDTLVNVFKKRGFSVYNEFYVNDGGGQVRKFGSSVRARIEQIKTGTDTAAIPEGGYHGEYVLDSARTWLENPTEPYPAEDDDAFQAFDENIGRWAAYRLRDEQKETLEKFRVTFDNWLKESEIFDNSQGLATPQTAIENLKDRGLTYEKDDALYFKAGNYGDSEDRVIETSFGRFTYIVPDIAYHLRKYRGFAKAVNLLGPDHHGHILQLRAALRALLGSDEEKDFFHPIIVQQVKLKRGSKDVKMSKRAGVGITLNELMKEVDVDTARFFFLRRNITSPLDFDIDLARSHSDDNPVYYIQYAHARIKSILRQPAAFDPEPDTDLTVLIEKEELDVLRNLARFPWTLSAIVRRIEPHPLTVYLMDLAKVFHYFYTMHRVIGEDRKITAARLTLCKGVAGVLKEGLRLMGVGAPEKM